jgi:hypothetical protein
MVNLGCGFETIAPGDTVSGAANPVKVAAVAGGDSKVTLLPSTHRNSTNERLATNKRTRVITPERCVSSNCGEVTIFAVKTKLPTRKRYSAAVKSDVPIIIAPNAQTDGTINRTAVHDQT